MPSESSWLIVTIKVDGPGETAMGEGRQARRAQPEGPGSFTASVAPVQLDCLIVTTGSGPRQPRIVTEMGAVPYPGLSSAGTTRPGSRPRAASAPSAWPRSPISPAGMARTWRSSGSTRTPTSARRAAAIRGSAQVRRIVADLDGAVAVVGFTIAEFIPGR